VFKCWHERLHYKTHQTSHITQ